MAAAVAKEDEGERARGGARTHPASPLPSTNASIAAVAAASLTSQCAIIGAAQSRPAPPSARTGGAARPSASSDSERGHTAGAARQLGGGRGGGTAPVRSHALRNGMRVPQWPEEKPAGSCTAAGSYSKYLGEGDQPVRGT